MESWNGFNNHWRSIAETKQAAVHFLRFEDLLTNPLPTLTQIFEFVLGVNSIEGTYIEKRIKDAVARRE